MPLSPGRHVLRAPVYDATLGEYLLDARDYTLSGLARSVLLPAKDANNPLLPHGSNADTWDADKGYCSAYNDSGTIRLWYNAYDQTADLTKFRLCYATSADGGATFTKPSIGRVTYAGSTSNNIVRENIVADHVTYDAASGKWVAIAEDLDGTSGGVNVLTASSPSGPFTLVKRLTLPAYSEAKSIANYAGRQRIFYTAGHTAQQRSVGVWESETLDLAGNWTDYGIVLPAVSQNQQMYSLGAYSLTTILVGFVMVYDHSAETIRMDLYASRDAHTWTQVAANWLPLGADGSFDDSMIGHGFGPVDDGSNNWQFFYTGYPLGHDVATLVDSRIGRATLGLGRLAKVAGTGTLTTKVFQPSAGAVLTVNADASGGGSLKVEVLDAAGNALSGYAAAQADAITSNTYATHPTWTGPISMPTGSPIALRFTLTSATLYSFTVA